MAMRTKLPLFSLLRSSSAALNRPLAASGQQPWRALSYVSPPAPPTSQFHPSAVPLVPQRSLLLTGFAHQVRHMTSDLSALPDIKDSRICNALKALLGSSWLEVEREIEADVESALSSSSDDSVGKDALADAWRSAQAVEKFGGILGEILLELNDLSGGTGEDVKPIPDSTYAAIEAAHRKYCTYLDSFGEDEAYLKKKVEHELGSLLLQIKQRLSGMDPKWSKITLLGTSGLSGSYIELR